MSWIAVATIGGAVVSSAISADAAGDAADQQSAAAANDTALRQQQFNQIREDQQPYREAGYGALGRLQQLLGLGGDRNAADYGSLTRPFTGADLESEPGYQFEREQGERAIQRAGSAAGRRLSGAQLMALQRYGQGLASTRYDRAFDRNQVTGNTLFNRLSGVSGTGQTATDQVGRAGERFADAAGGNLIGAANVGAASRVAQGNIFGDAINQGISIWQRRPQSSGGVSLRADDRGDYWRYGDEGE
jgi:hypothetical protein